MSLLESISIQGIRSFDPKNNQSLNFLKPVTLILGQNGTGKTTIIESLNYATTGDLPAGSKTGGSFVHDPKVAGDSEVKAKVSLTIKDVKGDFVTITRALKTTQKDKNKPVTMKTLDSTIKRYMPNGETNSISSKCADINVEVTNSLGVSKAVLENVIFCHQEDSNWPLTEAKQVKERFDNLFASARYVKALDSIRKIKLDKENNIKTYKSELKYLQNDLNESNTKLSEQNELQRQAEVLVSKIGSVRTKLEPIDATIEQYRNQFTKLSETKRHREMSANEKKMIEKLIRDLEKNISVPINYTAVELEKLISDSDLTLLNLEQSVGKEESNINSLEKEINDWRKENNQLLHEKGAIDSKISDKNNKQQEFHVNLQRLANEINLTYEKDEADLTIRNIENYIANLELEYRDEKKVFDNKLGIIEEKLECQKSEKITLENEIDMNKRSLNQKEKGLNNLVKKFEAIGHNTTKLNSNNAELSELKRNLEELQSNFNSEQTKKNLQRLSKSITDLDNEIHDSDILINKYQIDEKKYNEINSLQQQRSEKNSFSKRLRSRHNDSLMTLFDNIIPEANLKKMLDQKLLEFRNKHSEFQKLDRNLQSKLSASEFELKQMKDNAIKHQQVIDKFDEDVYGICGNYDLTNAIKEKRDRKTKLEEELLTLQSSVSLYSKFQDMLKKNKSDCPLCHREFKHDSEVDDLIDEINEKCINAPSELNKITNELSQIDDVITSLFKLDTQSDKIRDLKERVIGDLESRCQIKKKEICDFQISIAQFLQDDEINSKNEKMASSILGDVANMEKYNDEIKIIDKNVKNLEQQITLSDEEFKIEFEKVRNRKKSIQNDLKDLKNDLEKERKIYEDSTSKENMLNNKINRITSENLDIQKDLQEWSGLQLQKDTLMDDITVIQAQLHISQEKLTPVTRLLKEIVNERNSALINKNEYESSANLKISYFQKKLEVIKRNRMEINKIKSENLNEMLENIDIKIAHLNSKIQKNSTAINDSKSLIGQLNSRINNHKLRLREYKDTLQIRHHSEKILKIEESIGILDGQLTGIDLLNIDSKMKELEKERRQFKEQMDSLEFRNTQINTQINCIVKELNNSRLKEAESNYLAMVYKLKVLELAISDLEKYYKALDKAIMSYHQAKMAEINKILKELWRNTYTGKDIDYIEICSDEESSSASTKRRTYNYRVVMVKHHNGARLDMRGRCSAGQKVLACLLIRLALAEVFCLHCGVLALDEPTTNLDGENIENLAYSLVEIINSRSKQTNFQLIVITHDEEFVNLLGQSDYVDDYYKIFASPSFHYFAGLQTLSYAYMFLANYHWKHSMNYEKARSYAMKCCEIPDTKMVGEDMLRKIAITSKSDTAERDTQESFGNIESTIYFPIPSDDNLTANAMNLSIGDDTIEINDQEME